MKIMSKYIEVIGKTHYQSFLFVDDRPFKSNKHMFSIKNYFKAYRKKRNYLGMKSSTSEYWFISISYIFKFFNYKLLKFEELTFKMIKLEIVES